MTVVLLLDLKGNVKAAQEKEKIEKSGFCLSATIDSWMTLMATGVGFMSELMGEREKEGNA